MAYRIALWSSDEKEILRWVGRTEERQIVGSESAIKVCKECGTWDRQGMRTVCSKGRPHNMVLRATANRKIHESPCHITAKNMVDNAMPDGSARARAAQIKVQYWPYEHDTKAVLVTPRH